MSEKTITFRYHDEVKQVNIANYEECKNAFQREFSISDEEMKKLSLFYYDEEAEALVLNDNEDYRIFWESDFNEIEAKDNNEEEKLDSLRSATIFKKQNEEPIKDPLSKNESIGLDNSISLENSSNIAQIFDKKNNNQENFEDAKSFNDASKMLDLMAEEKKNKDMIEELKKQMEEMKLKHEQEMKKKDEENQKKYKDALVEKENEIKKKVEEEKEKQIKEYKIKTENELKEKYENEMKSNIILKEKELDAIKSKIELENQKKIEEIQKKKTKKDWKKLKKKKKKIKRN